MCAKPNDLGTNHLLMDRIYKDQFRNEHKLRIIVLKLINNTSHHIRSRHSIQFKLNKSIIYNN